MGVATVRGEVKVNAKTPGDGGKIPQADKGGGIHGSAEDARRCLRSIEKDYAVRL